MAASGSIVEVRKPLNILIIGGSLGGLMAGFLLKRNGHNVTILEQAASSEREGLAAGIGFSLHVRTFFENELGIDGSVLGVLHKGFEVLDDKLNVQYFIPREMRMTSWDCAYYQTRAKFDGLKSSYIEHPEKIETEGTGTYETGKRTLKVEPSEKHLTAVVEDVATGITQHYKSDIIIAADGANSSTRRQLNPNLAREEPGYILWRGTVPTGDLPDNIRARIENRALIYPGKYTYAVIYTIPGDRGSLKPGENQINIAWYFWPTSPTIAEIMTDTDGHQHRTTVPKGKLRPEIWASQVEASKPLLPPEIYDLITRIKQPFVTVVSSISAPKAAYFDNRLFLLGDALTQSQPNSGMGTNLAAYAAYGLADVIGKAGISSSGQGGEVLPAGTLVDPKKVAAWEQNVLAHNEITRVHAVAFGSWYLHSWPVVALRYARWWVLKWWYAPKDRLF
ncbi:Putative FAD/NAD(P)-binding domain superfamily [Septoria linicola]|uniref:FAD/NAD(P)-binding domain superfamily n=1 Tax=Septoria linicola TaxID=215465 RepID=A0A9Q9AQD8_9PEZI|nr:Putative FAD/NAD(P)-binding domain superfamily [Septoria linicola]